MAAQDTPGTCVLLKQHTGTGLPVGQPSWEGFLLGGDHLTALPFSSNNKAPCMFRSERALHPITPLMR